MPACLCRKRPTCRKPVSRNEMKALQASGSWMMMGAMIFGKCGRVKRGMERRSCGSMTGRRLTTDSAEDLEVGEGVGGTIKSEEEEGGSESEELDELEDAQNLRWRGTGRRVEGMAFSRGAARAWREIE